MEREAHRENAVQVRLQEQRGGPATLVLEGRLDVQSAGACWREIESRLKAARPTRLEVDASRLEVQGGIGIALLRFLSDGGMTPHATVTLRGLSAGAQRILEAFDLEDFHKYRRQQEPKENLPEEVGAITRHLLRDLKEQITFIGAVLRSLPLALVHPKRMRWGEILYVLETAGANALPVIAIFSWLVGLVLALEAAHPLSKLGGQIFIADMIGFASIRDTGPLVTAVMLAGRSGSAFAAELGTMKVNAELDALRTMGLEPIRFLALQRVVAALLLTPLLTLYAMGMGMIGGVMVMRFLGFPPRLIFHQIISRVELGDLTIGLLKSVVFGLIIGGVGCLRGLQTKEGPRAVGVSTTRSVVACIMLVILSNTLFSAVDYFFAPAPS